MNKHPLRKSCSFCRARKIKCSNETICEACRKQNVDCVYDFEPYRPGEPSHTHSQSQTDNLPKVDESATVRTEDRVPTVPQRRRTLSPSSGLAAPHGGESPEATPLSEHIGQELEAMFADNFLTESDGPRCTSWQKKIASLHRSVGSLSTEAAESSGSAGCPQISNYASLFSSITEDLVGSVIGKFGNLGCHQVEGGGSRFFVNGLKQDSTSSMFDPVDASGNQDSATSSALADYGSRKIAQKLDAWFFSHPLSLLISKTLLIHDLRAGTHDEILLAVMLADASSFIGDATHVQHSQELFNLATSRLQSQVLDLSMSPRSFPPQSASHRGVSTAQALLLLGWNALCRSQIRRATCYIRLATQLATKLVTHKWAYHPPVAGRVNGIEVSEVVKETMAYLWCISFTLSLWLQTQVHEHPNLPHNLPASAFLPMDASSSVLIRLDEASDNISTLQRQKAALTDIWPLTHVSTVIAYILALYPKEAQRRKRSDGVFWQESTLLALRRIREPSNSQNLDSVCREIYRVLMENASLVNGEVSHTPARALVVMVYHTIGIHVLFPRQTQAQTEHPESSVLTPELIDRFCASAEEIHNILTAVHHSLDTGSLSMISSQLHPSSPEIFILALDSCSRALSSICSHQGRSGRPHGFDFFTYYRSRLESLAQRLFALADEQFFCPRASLHAVRRRLKGIIGSFHYSQTSSNWHHRAQSDSSSPMSRNTNTPSVLEPISSTAPPAPGGFPLTTSMMPSAHLPDDILSFDLPISQSMVENNAILPENEWKGGGQPQPSIPSHPHMINHVTNTPELLAADVGYEASWFQGDQAMMDISLNPGTDLNIPGVMFP
ncbi:hypothetical protein F5Y17DRAFT_412425 [Xylariaceae sp. FL0594]|nr:hypothetical protein F5Y17DRAFT_412425 [Xylariaceae sp. FL0594]